MKTKTLFLIGSLVCAAGLGSAQSTFNFSGTTTGMPVFNRTTETGDLSSFGTAVSYSVFPFRIGAVGSYSFTAVAGNPVNFDTFIHLYANAFNPSNATNNFVAANDDLNPANPAAGSRIGSVGLDPAVNYFFVVNGFDNSDTGAFSATIAGPGAILPVPEPGVWALLGLGGLFVLGRKRLGQTV